MRCGGGSAAQYVTVCGLGPRDKLKVVAGAMMGNIVVVAWQPV